MTPKNKLFRDAFKHRHKMDMAVVDKHFDNLCKAAEDISSSVGYPMVSVLTPSGVIHFEKRPVDFTFSFEKIKGKKK